MWHDAAAWIKCMLHRVIHQIWYIAGVYIGKAEQSPREIGRIVVGTEHTSELFVEHTFSCLAAKNWII